MTKLATPILSFVKGPLIQRLSFVLCLALMWKALAVTAGESKSETAPARKPSGIYAVVVVEEGGRHKERRSRSDPDRFEAVLRNPAVAGIALRAYWKPLEPEEGKYDFHALDDAFSIAKEHNKTVQLILVPGFHSPLWLLNQLSSCDPYLDRAHVPEGLLKGGKATFTIPYGPKHNEKFELPLPWDAAYKTAWRTFLTEVARRYNALPQLVSIAVAGPTSVSAEMSFPSKTAEDMAVWQHLLELSFPPGPYRDSNRAIVEEWQAAIEFYGKTFSNLTIVITRGAGLLRFPHNGPEDAKNQIIDGLVHADLGSNRKATQTSGMNAARDSEGGIEGAKALALKTCEGERLHRILAGGQFNSSATAHPSKVGRPQEGAEGADIPPAEALCNVLRNYFNNTPFGKEYGGQNGPVPVHYLQIYEEDVLHANEHGDVQRILLDVKDKLSRLNRGS
ncbi:MAG: beta-galactosidase [Verrucomicrobia bacterium]|nr:beta-galactosidase [Verrucomicrobiota bacterium]